MMGVWKQYLYREMLICYAALLGICYGLYVFFDLVIHLKPLISGASFPELLEYYGAAFSKRLPILLPFTILIGSIRTLLRFQSRNELVALLASGIPMRRLIRPFLAVSCFAALFLYANYEYLLPRALVFMDTFEERVFDKKTTLASPPRIGEIILHDASKIIYRAYDAAASELSDAFWVVSCDKIYYAKRLDWRRGIPRGTQVFEIERNSAGDLEKTHSYPEYTFDKMPLTPNTITNSLMPAKGQSLSALATQIPALLSSRSSRAQEIKSMFAYKLFFPLLCLVAFLGPAPYCLAFRRSLPTFTIYLVAMSAFFFLLLLFQAAFTLSESPLLPFGLAIAIPWLLVLYVTVRKYLRAT